MGLDYGLKSLNVLGRLESEGFVTGKVFTEWTEDEVGLSNNLSSNSKAYTQIACDLGDFTLRLIGELDQV